MRALRVCVIATMIVLAVSFAGCGRRAKVNVTTPPSSEQTLGRELLDLQEAYEKGVITEKEYKDQKKKLLKQKK